MVWLPRNVYGTMGGTGNFEHRRKSSTTLPHSLPMTLNGITKVVMWVPNNCHSDIDCQTMSPGIH